MGKGRDLTNNERATVHNQMDNVLKAFEEYPKEKITGIWACYFNNLRGIMSVDGGNDCSSVLVLAARVPLLKKLISS